VKSASARPVKNASQSHPARSREGQSVSRSTAFWANVARAADTIASSAASPVGGSATRAASGFS